MCHGPHRLTPAEVARLTDRQIEEWYNRDRDPKTGAVRPAPPLEPAREVETAEEARAKFFALGASLGVPADTLEAKWAEAVARRERGET